MHRFRARLYRIGLLRCVDVPLHVSRRLGAGSRIPVRGNAQGVPFRSTLVSRGGGAHKLYVHSRTWRARGVDAGDRIEIALERDDEPRDIETPRDFLRALQDHPVARAYFRTCPEGLRREIANWLAAAKQRATRERRIDKALQALEQRAGKRNTPRARRRGT